MDMTLAQMRGLAAAAARIERARTVDIAMAMRAAQSDSKDFQAWVDAMRGE